MMGHNDLGSAYLGQLVAKQMMEDAMTGKVKAKKASFLKRMIKKVAK
ncbi:hypothetical protein GT360_20970 [Vibrio astriarenae]|uniref:Uncharacterized protein n=1 Tax=Vibrio astriarenae TaxID=1481923 RepID=A0A7Z2T815_9VIBR|nr:hypothetical protein [Vibrio astriarenae]QIA65970.1 hypothetical protein GT360_20970 [Vibrio astriarenae]